MGEAPIHLRARYDGRALILEEPVDLPQGVVLDLWAESAKVQKKARRKPGSAKGLITMREDFDDPIPGFEDYL